MLDVDTLAPPDVRPRTSLWLLRITLTAHLVVALCQPVLAGLFLTGDVGAITAHARVAEALFGSCVLAAVAAAFHVVAGRGRVGAPSGLVLLALVEGVQIAMGYQRQLAVHIPLGVAIVAMSVALAVWVWAPSARRAR